MTEVASALTAYLAKNPCAPADIPKVATAIREALGVMPSKATADQVKASITPDHLISFEDGKKYKVLTRHLSGRGLTMDEYREKHGLPADYPVCAPNYSARRSELARANGLGQLRRDAKG